MNFDLSEDQQVLSKMAASFVKRESPVSRFRKLREDALGYSPDVLRRMGELGWLGLPFPEALGGSGVGFVELSILFEEMGTALVPEPLLESVVLGGMAILRAGSPAQHEKWLPPVIEGRKTLALAHAERHGRYDVAQGATRAVRRGGGFILDGEKTFVLNGHAADALVVAARTAGAAGDAKGLSLFVVEKEAAGLHVQPIKTMDGRHAAIVRFSEVAVGDEQLLGAPGEALPLLELLMDMGAVCAAAEAVGIMRTLMAMTTDYLRTREQFGVKIGSFQVLQHRAVDMFIETEMARSVSMKATLSIDEPDANARKSATSSAKAQIAASGRLVSQQAIQLHGGIGITDEHDVGLYFKRMYALNTLFGDEEYHLARFASLPAFTAGLPPEAAI